MGPIFRTAFFLHGAPSRRPRRRARTFSGFQTYIFNSFPQLLLVVENEGVQVCAREALRMYAVEDPANTARGGMMGDCGLSVARARAQRR